MGDGAELGFAHAVFKGPMGHPSGLVGLKFKGEAWAGKRDLGAFGVEMVAEAREPEERS